MNDRLVAPLQADMGVADTHAAQQQAFARHPYPSASKRRQQLRALKRQLHRYQDLLAEAMSRDFGFRSPAESITSGRGQWARAWSRFARPAQSKRGGTPLSPGLRQ